MTAGSSAVIYALVDPRSNAVRYVGKAENVTKRLIAHLNDRANTRKARWIQSLVATGLRPRVVTLDVVEDIAWQAAERGWIALLRKAGCDLTNHTDGGEGLCNASAETREKLRQLRMADWADPLRRQFLLDIIRSPERRQRISAQLVGLRKRPEHIAKLPQMQRGRTISPEHAQKLRDHLRAKGYKRPIGVPLSPTTRAKISAALRGNQHTLGRVMPETERLQRSISQRGRPKSPETREKMRVAALRRWEQRRKEVKHGEVLEDYSDSAHAPA